MHWNQNLNNNNNEFWKKFVIVKKGEIFKIFDNNNKENFRLSFI